MMGHDVNYSTSLSDSELLAIAKTESRVLLTRDLELFQRAVSRGIETDYVTGNTEAERLAKLSSRFGIPLSIDLTLSRCPKCNTRIAPIGKEEVANKVEEKTLLHYNEFWLCPNCGAVYWQGSHWTKIRATLKEAKQFVEKKELS